MVFSPAIFIVGLFSGSETASRAAHEITNRTLVQREPDLIEQKNPLVQALACRNCKIKRAETAIQTALSELTEGTKEIQRVQIESKEPLLQPKKRLNPSKNDEKEMKRI